MVGSNNLLDAIQDFLDTIQDPNLDAIQIILGCHTRAIETKNVLFVMYVHDTMSSLYVYTNPSMESLKRDNKFVLKTQQPW